jgi:hypothetical protein
VRQNETPGGVVQHLYSSVNRPLSEAASDALWLPLRGEPHVPPDTSLLLELLMMPPQIRMDDRPWNTVISFGFET